MITATLTAAILGVLALMGIKLTFTQIAGLVIALKILVVLGVMGVAAFVSRRNQTKETSEKT